MENWRDDLYDRFTSSKVGMAVIAELLLRSPQTEGELRGRASRMEPIDDLEALRNVLHPLVERKLVLFLGPEGRRGTLITHGFHAAAELEGLRSQAVVSAEARPQADAKPQTEEIRAEIAGLPPNCNSFKTLTETWRKSFTLSRNPWEGRLV